MANNKVYSLPSELTNICDIRPDYGTYLNLWDYYLDSYVGGEEYKKGGYLWHSPHGDGNTDIDEYNFKVRTASYDNNVKRAVDNYIMQINSKPVTRKGLDFEIQLTSYRDYDYKEIDINRYWRLIQTYVLIFGECYSIMDQPIILSDNENPMTISNDERLRLNIKYINQIILPQYVPVLQYDIYGNLVKALIETYKGYVLWTPEYYQEWIRDDIINSNALNNTGLLKDTTYTQQPELANPYGMIPLIQYSIDTDKNGYGDSFVSDIADLNRDIYNIDAIRKADLFINSQNVLLLPLSQELAQNYKDWNLVTEDGQIKIKGKSMLPFTPGANPEYLVKNLDYHVKLSELRDDLINSINTKANTTMYKLIAQSGVSKAYDEHNRNQHLSNLSYIFEEFERINWGMFFKIFGINKTEDNYSIYYKHSFDLLDRDTRLNNLVATKKTVQNIEVHKAIDKIILKDQLSGSLTDDELNELIDIVDKQSEKLVLTADSQSYDSVPSQSETTNNNNNNSETQLENAINNIEEK